MLTVRTFKHTASRLTILSLLLLLALGARAQFAVAAALNTSLCGVPQSQGPIHEEEEETRHDAKLKATDRRNRDDVPTPSRTLIRLLAEPRPAFPAPPHTQALPDHESDFRNGLGAPLLC